MNSSRAKDSAEPSHRLLVQSTRDEPLSRSARVKISIPLKIATKIQMCKKKKKKRGYCRAIRDKRFIFQFMEVELVEVQFYGNEVE